MAMYTYTGGINNGNYPSRNPFRVGDKFVRPPMHALGGQILTVGYIEGDSVRALEDNLRTDFRELRTPDGRCVLVDE